MTLLLTGLIYLPGYTLGLPFVVDSTVGPVVLYRCGRIYLAFEIVTNTFTFDWCVVATLRTVWLRLPFAPLPVALLWRYVYTHLPVATFDPTQLVPHVAVTLRYDPCCQLFTDAPPHLICCYPLWTLRFPVGAVTTFVGRCLFTRLR